MEGPSGLTAEQQLELQKEFKQFILANIIRVMDTMQILYGDYLKRYRSLYTIAKHLQSTIAGGYVRTRMGEIVKYVILGKTKKQIYDHLARLIPPKDKMPKYVRIIQIYKEVIIKNGLLRDYIDMLKTELVQQKEFKPELLDNAYSKMAAIGMYYELCYYGGERQYITAGQMWNFFVPISLSKFMFLKFMAVKSPNVYKGINDKVEGREFYQLDQENPPNPEGCKSLGSEQPANTESIQPETTKPDKEPEESHKTVVMEQPKNAVQMQNQEGRPENLEVSKQQLSSSSGVGSMSQHQDGDGAHLFDDFVFNKDFAN